MVPADIPLAVFADMNCCDCKHYLTLLQATWRTWRPLAIAGHFSADDRILASEIEDILVEAGLLTE